MKNKFYLSILFCLFFGNGFGQYEIEWQRTLGGSSYDYLGKVIQTSDGGYLVGGSSWSGISGDKTDSCRGLNDFWIIKLDSLGIIEWQKTIGGNSGDWLTTIFQANDGCYFLAGTSFSGISGDKTLNSFGNEDYWLVKLDHLGNINWQKAYGGILNDKLISVDKTKDGGLILAGISQSDSSGNKTTKLLNSDPNGDIWLVRIDTSGNIIWQSDCFYNTSHEFVLYSVKQLPSGSFFLYGYYRWVDVDDYYNSDVSRIYFKFDSLGSQIWERSVNGPLTDYYWNAYYYHNQMMDVIDEDNILIGFTQIFSFTHNHSFNFNKIDSSSQKTLVKEIRGNNRDYLNAVIHTNDGGCFLIGGSNSGSSINKQDSCYGESGFNDFWIVRLDSHYDLQWETTLGGINRDWPTSITNTSDNGFIIGGYSNSDSSKTKTENSRGEYDYWIIKFKKKNLVTGKLFADLNNNQIQDSNESSLSGSKIIETNTGSSVFSRPGGNYYLTLDTGNFHIEPATVNYYASNPVDYSLNFSVLQQVASDKNFAFAPIESTNDLQVNIQPVIAFRPGFYGCYNINCKNVGTTTVSPSLIFYPDSLLNFASASINPSNVSSNSVSWNLPVLNPFEEINILAKVYMDQNVALGVKLISSSQINTSAPDANMANNFSSCSVEVTGSFDPNDITVSEKVIYDYNLNPSPPELIYTIRFQNTGTDTAFNVWIKGMIPEGLDFNSFELIASSSPVEVDYNFRNRVLKFSFYNILLPDSSTNETMSHGWIVYRVKPHSNLILGDSIKNQAFIYFDYNNPVATNYATTVIEQIQNAYEGMISMQPNPARDFTQIVFLMPNSIESTLTFLDIQGRIIFEENIIANQPHQINISSLSNGIYILKITCDGKNYYSKLVKE